MSDDSQVGDNGSMKPRGAEDGVHVFRNDDTYEAFLMLFIGDADSEDGINGLVEAFDYADDYGTVRPIGNSKGVALGKALTSIGAEMGDDVRVVIMRRG